MAFAGRRATTGFVSLGAALVVGVASFLAVVGAGNSSAIIKLLDGGMWVSSKNADPPSVDHINLSTGRPDYRVEVGSHDSLLIRNDGSRALVRNEATGALYAVGLGRAQAELAKPVIVPGKLVPVTGGGKSFVVDPEEGRVQLVTVPRVGVVELSAPVLVERGLSDRPGVDDAGVLWTGVPSKGIVVPLQAPATAVEAGKPAPPIKGQPSRVVGGSSALGIDVSIVGGDAYVLARTADGAVVSRVEIGKAARTITATPLARDARIAPIQGTDDAVNVLEPANHQLQRIDPVTGRRTSLKLPPAFAGHELEPPVVAGGRLIVADQTSGQVLVVDPGQPERAQTLQVGKPGEHLDVSAKPDGVSVNVPDSERVLTVDQHGRGRIGNRYVVAPKPNPTPVVTPPTSPPPPPATKLNNGTNSGIVPVAGAGSGAGSAPIVPTQPAKIQPPQAPVNLDARASTGEVRLAWQRSAAGGPVDRYIVSGPDGDVPGSPFAADQTSITVKAPNGKPVTFRIRSVGEGGESATVPFDSVTPQTNVPGAPTNVTAKPADTAAHVAWTAAAGNGTVVTKYVVRYSTPRAGTGVAEAPGSATSVDVPKLINGEPYTFTVEAEGSVPAGGSAVGPKSDPTKAITPYGAPFAPTGLTATPMDSALRVSFASTATEHNGSPATGSEIALLDGASSAATPPASAKITAAASPKDMTGLTNGSSYTVWARLINAAGPGSWTAAVQGQPRTTPSIDLQSLELVGDRTLRATFSVNNGGSAPTQCVAVIQGVREQPGSCSSIDLGGLGYSTDYTVYVYADNAAGHGQSNARTARTNNAPPPPPQATVSISKGRSAKGQSGCSANACAYIRVGWSNFAGGSHTIVCRASNGDEGGFYTYSTSTNPSEYCYYGFSGRSVWVTLDGVESNHVTW